MAVLDPKLAYGAADLTGWWHAFEDFTYAERSGLGGPMVYEGAGPGTAARVEHIRFAYPGMRFAGDAAQGPLLSSLLATNAKSVYCAFRANSITSNEAQHQRNEAVWCQTSAPLGGVGLFLRNNAGTYQIAACNYTGAWQTTNSPAVLEMELDRLYVAAVWHNGSQLRLKLDDGAFSKAINRAVVNSGATSSLASNLLIGRSFYDPGAGYYYSAIDVFEIIFRNVADSDEDGETIVAYMLSQWGDRGDAIEIARAVGSERAALLASPAAVPEIVTPRLDLLDLDLGDSIAVQALGYPHRDGEDGVLSVARDKRAEIRLTSIELDGDNLAAGLKITGIDRRLSDCGCFLRFDPPLAASLWNDGSLVLLPRDAAGADEWSTVAGSTSFMRYLRRPSDGLVVAVYPGQWSLEPEGLLGGAGDTSLLLNCFFSEGNNSWTRSSGGGGLTPAVETTEGQFWAEAGLTTQNMLIEQDNPAANEKTVVQAATMGGGSGGIRLWIRYRNDTGETFVWRLQRTGGDNWWWNDSTPAWQAGQCDNTIPTSDVIARHVSELITTPASIQHTLTFASLVGGTASRKDRIYEVLCCEHVHSGTPLKTTTAALARPYNYLGFSFASTRPGIPLDRGTILCAFHPNAGWGFGNTNMEPVWFAIMGALNLQLYYNHSTEVWHVIDAGAGDATVAQALVDLQDDGYHWAAVRYASGDGDEDLAADTFDVIADGVQGAAAAYAGWDVAATQSLRFREMHGHVRAFQAFPRVLSLAECAAWGRRHCR